MLIQLNLSEESVLWAIGSEPQFPDLYLGHHSQGSRMEQEDVHGMLGTSLPPGSPPGS